MIARRDLFIGAACLATAGTGALLKPRRNVSLLAQTDSLAKIVPASFGGWRSEDIGDPLAINGPKTLSSQLYNQLLSRAYVNDETGEFVFTLMAYGGRQTDELQLHRPEVCYPAFGFELLQNEPMTLKLATGVTVPARRMLASSEERNESVIYWTRMGEYLPSSGAQQREDRFRIALQGIIPDGLLVRFSTKADNAADPWKSIERFVAGMVAAVPAKDRRVLVGTERANALRTLA